jgi:hypothetical protein
MTRITAPTRLLFVLKPHIDNLVGIHENLAAGDTMTRYAVPVTMRQ